LLNKKLKNGEEKKRFNKTSVTLLQSKKRRFLPSWL